ncbi:MAG: hypothetical protein HY000_18095 [Planctomycetes bacterium]|nr:hypothetical protein [Planctomycetota bacterium]
MLDANGNTLVHPIAPNRDAFFNVTQDQPTALGTETTLVGQTVSVDLSRLVAGTSATVIFRLVNNDSDVNTSVRISCVASNTAPTVTLTGPASADEGQTKRYSYTTSDTGQDTSTLVSASCGTSGLRSNPTFDAITGAGSFDCTFPDVPAVTDVSVQVADSDGATSNTSTITVTIANVPPTLTISGAAAVNEGTPNAKSQTRRSTRRTANCHTMMMRTITRPTPTS